MRARRLLVAIGAAALATALTACGLPTPEGVQSAEDLPGAQGEQQAPQVLERPPGPQPGDSPEQVVAGFLVAQGSPEEDYGVARSFLARGVEWAADADGVVVFAGEDPVPAPAGLRSETDARVTTEVRVTSEIRPDRSARARGRDGEELDYRLVSQDGAWRLAEVPRGLTLSQKRLAATFGAYAVMLLSPSRVPVPHLVPDLVRLPSTADALPARLVERVLRGPTSALAASAVTAAPEGTQRRGVRQLPAGVVEVDLTGGVTQLADTGRRELAAQLFWTLRGALPDVSALRLLVDGSPLEIDGDDGPVTRDRVAELDPAGGDATPDPLAITQGRSLVALAANGSTSAPVLGELKDVTEAVADPASGRVAALTAAPGSAETTLLTGLPPAPLTVARRGARLTSPTWGDGAFGVWTLRPDGPGGSEIRVGEAGSQGTRVRVLEPGLSSLSLSSASVLRVSRDGARVAIVDASGTLFLGRVELAAGGPLLVDLHRALDQALAVRDVAWVDGTTLLALQTEPSESLPQPLIQLSVDGVEVFQRTLNTGNDTSTRTLAAFGQQVVVAAALPATPGTPASSVLYRGRFGSGFTLVEASNLRRPRFPG